MPVGLDHDPPAKEKAVPLGILEVTTGLLTLVFAGAGTSDAWVDARRVWWAAARSRHRGSAGW